MSSASSSTLQRQLLAKVRGRRLAVVGDCILDRYVFGETGRVSREAPVIVMRQEREEYRLGGAANVARNLAALGAEVTLFAGLGRGQERERAQLLLNQAGVAVNPLEGGSMTVKTRYMAGAIGTSPQQVLRVDQEASTESAPDLVWTQALLDPSFEGMVVSDYGYGTVDAALIQRLCETSRRRPVCGDARVGLERFQGATAITPNFPEATSYMPRIPSSQGELELAGAALRQRLGTQYLLVTQGSEGMTLFDEGRADHIGVVGPEGAVTDVTGAGDTVIAAFSACLAAGGTGRDAMRIANAAAGVVVHKLGCATASPQEVEALL